MVGTQIDHKFLRPILHLHYLPKMEHHLVPLGRALRRNPLRAPMLVFLPGLSAGAGRQRRRQKQGGCGREGRFPPEKSLGCGHGGTSYRRRRARGFFFLSRAQARPKGSRNSRLPSAGATIPSASEEKSMSFCPRAIALTLLACFLVCGAGTAQEKQPDWSKVQIKASKVSGNIYLLEGQGGNIAASVGEDGIVIVDDEFAPLAEKIQAALKDLKITDKPVRFVINTHYHGDHTGGNPPFANAGSTVIAQDNVRKRLMAGGTAGNGGSVKMEVQPAQKAALPIITFEHDVTVHLNGEDIRALHFPAGHTDGDAIIFFPKNNVVH